MLRSVNSIRVGLFMELEVHSLMDPPTVIESVTQELGHQVMKRSDIQHNSDGQNLLATLSLGLIKHRNQVILKDVLEGCPNGINLHDIEHYGGPYGDYEGHEPAYKMAERIKRVPGSGVNQRGLV